MRIQVRAILVLLCVTIAACGRAPEDQIAVTPMDAFGTTASNVFFYYENLDAASSFYSDVLGFRTVADYGKAKIMQVAPKSFLTLVDASIGMHSAEEPKTTAIALVTDQLEQWWDYIQTQDVEMRTTEFALREGGPHDGFVAIDPEGYFLEFERFNAHEENRNFVPLLDSTKTLYPEPGT
jgi:catechol 2,3-dioxygenase-like lactoylglutathione lyase family enzyme